MNQYRQDKLFLEEENNIIKLEKEKIGCIKETKIITLQEQVSRYEIENNKLKEMNEYSKQKLEECTPKVWKYDEVYSKYSKLSDDYEKLMTSIQGQNEIILILKREKDEINSKYELSRIELEALKNDKLYLSKDSISSGEKLREAQDKNRSLEEELKELRKSNNTYIDKLTEKNCNLDNVYEMKLKSELSEMKGKYNTDLENLKRLYEDISEKRCLYLQEERDEYKHRNILLEKNIKDKDQSLDFMNNELRILQKRTDEEISYLKIQLKIKSEELDRLTNLYEENIAIAKLYKNESESHKDKMDIFRIELIQKEANHIEIVSDLKSQLSILKEKIANYELIENELDKVIIDSNIIEQ